MTEDKTYIGDWDSYHRKIGHTIWVEKYPDYYERIFDWQAEPGMVRYGGVLGYDEHPYVFEVCPECKETKRWVRLDRSGILCKGCAKRKCHRERGEHLEIEGELRFRNGRVLVWNGNHEIELFTFLASYGLWNKDVRITVERIKEDEKM